MGPNIEIFGLDEWDKMIRSAPKDVLTSARLAINTVAGRSGLALIRRAMTDQIAFPTGYLGGDRLSVASYAQPNKLEATIRARGRATSLARFAQGSGLGSKTGVTVRVKKGRTTTFTKGWLVRLKRGASLTEDNYNIGLAVRVNPGESIVNKRSTHQSWLVKGKVALLYGPSVDQVFRTVADDVEDELAGMVKSEFYRQFERLTR